MMLRQGSAYVSTDKLPKWYVTQQKSMHCIDKLRGTHAVEMRDYVHHAATGSISQSIGIM